MEKEERFKLNPFIAERTRQARLLLV